MNFRPVRDPVTGRIDMVPVVKAEWGEYARCDDVAAVIGKERYDRFYPDDFDGQIKGLVDLHDATIVEITALLAPNGDAEMLGRLTRQWVDASALVRDGTLSMATIAFTTTGIGNDGHEGRTLVVLNVTQHETIMVMFCSCGDILDQPIAYWNDAGAFATAGIDDDVLDDAMLDSQIQMRRWETTEIAVAARRKQDEQPSGVIDMAAFRALRAVRG